MKHLKQYAELMLLVCQLLNVLAIKQKPQHALSVRANLTQWPSGSFLKELRSLNQPDSKRANDAY